MIAYLITLFVLFGAVVLPFMAYAGAFAEEER